jgi:hypothetical protein
MLTAAWVVILDYKAEIAAGTADQHFNFRMNGGLVLSIPHEMMNFIGNRIPTKIDAPTRAFVLKRSIDNMDGIFTGDLDIETWNGLTTEHQATVMEAACGQLCVGFFNEEAARAA